MSQHEGQTDQVTKIELPSCIQQVIWTKNMTPPGGQVGLEIFTYHVGNNSKMDIELSDSTGKTIGKYKETISGNRFWAQIQVPVDAKDMLLAKIRLPKHGLEMKSNPLIVLPLIEIKNVKWDKKEARRKDILKLTADIKEVPDGTEAEIEIWEHDADGAHDLITQFPVLVKDNKVDADWEFQYHEDTDDILTEEESEKGYNPPEYFFRVKVGNVFADSELLEFIDWIKIIVEDVDGNPIPDEDYVLHLADGSEKKGKLDDKGIAEINDVPPGRYRVDFPGLAMTMTMDLGRE